MSSRRSGDNHEAGGRLPPASGLQTIAIDGPAASGKTTIGRLLANRLAYRFIDTGSMYRAVTLAVLDADLDIDDEEAVLRLAEGLEIEIRPSGLANDGRLYTVLLGGRDVTWEIRQVGVDKHVSQVSAYPKVRALLVQRQRALAHSVGVVMVGRDIGTVVLPDAPLKLYIVASAEERARRRWKELCSRGFDQSYAHILADIRRRDQYDASRRYSPMRQAADAIMIDTTDRPPEDVVEEILRLPHFHERATRS
jgi:CMP/dCMP kinase